MTIIQQGKIRTFVNDLTVRCASLRNELAEMGFWKTYHKVDDVTNQLGWEAVEKMEKNND